MNSNLTRRGFIRSAALGSLAVGMSSSPFAQTVSKRLEWSAFKKTRDYASFMDAIKKMRANTNVADKRSWQYWTQAHLSYCPHSVSYFIAWHRGYLRLFENQLREVSGNPNLMLPYWDYYRDPAIPREFTDPSSANPLYITNRVNTRVPQALTLAPFSSTLTHFQRETNDSFTNAIAFEPSIENQPHNPVHDLIGGIMTTMQSPLDPIFWLHHANIDRLANAWAAAGGGRTLPPVGDPYWSGTFTYATKLTMLRSQTRSSRLSLGYIYDNETMPTRLPTTSLAAPSQSLLASPAALAQAQAPAQALPALPAAGRFTASRMRATATNRLALGGALGISLDNSSVSARVALDKSGYQMLRSVIDSFQLAPSLTGKGGKYSSVKVVLTNVKTSKKGEEGGYFYNLYLNLPENGRTDGPVENYLCGNVGPFRVISQRGMGATGPRVEFDVTGLLLANPDRDMSQYNFSFVRVNGDHAPDGEVLTIGECRLELA